MSNVKIPSLFILNYHHIWLISSMNQTNTHGHTHREIICKIHTFWTILYLFERIYIPEIYINSIADYSLLNKSQNDYRLAPI